MPKLRLQWNSVPKLILRAEVHRLVPKLFRVEVTRAEHRLPQLKGNFNVSDWSAVVRKTFKSKQTFVRIQIDSDNPENFLKHYYASMPTQITILNGYDGITCLGPDCQPIFLRQMNQVDEFIPGYKKFKNITIQTQVRF